MPATHLSIVGVGMGNNLFPAFTSPYSIRAGIPLHPPVWCLVLRVSADIPADHGPMIPSTFSMQNLFGENIPRGELHSQH